VGTPIGTKNHDAPLAFSAYFPACDVLKWCGGGYRTHFADTPDRLQ